LYDKFVLREKEAEGSQDSFGVAHESSSYVYITSKFEVAIARRVEPRKWHIKV
jgi:hypothetical protein